MEANIEAMLKDYQESPGAKKDTGLILIAIQGEYIELTATDESYMTLLGCLELARTLIIEAMGVNDESQELIQV